MSSYRLIERALKDNGPMSARELSEEIGMSLRLTQGALGWIRTERPGTIYIHGWQHEQCVSRLNMNAVYALGNKPDAKRLKPMTGAQRCKRWRHKRKSQVASVFHLPEKMYRRVQTPAVYMG